MEAELQTHLAFYLTGKRLKAHLDALDGLGLQPALFAGYRDLTSLRYDFPLVLVDGQTDGIAVAPLSGLIDGILDKVAKGDDGERIRKHVLRLEQAVRRLAASGTSGLFSSLWDRAAGPLSKADKLTADSLSRARANLKIDGEVVDCTATLPYRVFAHAWRIGQAQRAEQFSQDIQRLVLRLSEILQVEFVKSDAGKSAAHLKASFGTGPMDRFDFEAMSRILGRSTPKENLSASRRKRVTSLLATLRSQRFFPLPNNDAGEVAVAPYSFGFDSGVNALEAYRQRLPKLIELARAVAVAELEVKGEYNETKHGPLFDSFGANGLETADLARFPDYLVCLNAGAMSGQEQSTLTEIFSVDLPIKVLIQIDDVIEESPLGNGHLAFALRSKQLASMAMGMNGVFVLQSPASNLYQMREAIRRGLDFPGPALFSVFSGASMYSGNLPPYLIGAAALESRVFPAFAFDPAAGRNWASRFSLATNPQASLDWPLHEFAYEDDKHQRVSESMPFTLIDFVACDSRYGKHFARVPKTHWNGTLVPVGEALARSDPEHLDSVPYLTMVDPENRLQKVIVDEKLIREARRCRDMWNSLQELGGIHNSHANLLLAREKEIWAETVELAGEEAASLITSVAAAPSPVATPATAPSEPGAERSPDEAYIETPRCSTCNECTQINSKMFAYDGNKQAYIADLTAGTYAQLVEAAENCQVSIIHPGKPRNPNEPGLDELIRRAEAFL